MLYKFARILFTIYCYVFNRIRIYGRENEPENGPLILFCNHQSAFDILPLNVAIKRPIIFMGKESLFKIPIIGFIVRKYGAFPVNRERPDLSAIKNSLKTLKSNKILGIFPEGTRVKNGLTKEGLPPEIKPGFVMISMKSKATMLPVRIEYKRQFFIFNSIKVFIGKPFSIENEFQNGLKADEMSQVGRTLMNNLYNLNEDNI